MSYADDRASAAASIDEDGQVFTLAYPLDGTYDPATRSTGGTPPASQSVAGVILPLSPFRKAQGNVIEGDQQLLLSALNTTGTAITAPQVNGTIANGSKTWTIIAVDPLSPADLDIMFDCIVRRAP